MTLITLKFTPEMEDLIFAGKKICTTRDEQKGKIGICRVGNVRPSKSDRHMDDVIELDTLRGIKIQKE
jgi:hypothetical protein